MHVVYFYFVSLYTDWVDYSLIGTDPGMIDLDYLISGTLSILLLTAQADYIERSKNAITEDIKLKKDELTRKNMELLGVQHDLEMKNKRLEQKNKELEQFAYVASHDLQEPLRTTTSFVDLIQKKYKGKLDETADKYLSFIMQSSNRMRGLISDLLDYSMIGNKKEQQQVDCTTILNDVLADLGTAISEAGAQIDAEPLPIITGYPVEIKLLFQNLILNAIKFRRRDKIPRIKISVADKNNSWQFSVTDNGIGIAKEHNERIFIIFQRLHTQAQYIGSGIGLSHCRKIVELHNGKIWLESQVGKGTTFYFTIPYKNKTNEKQIELRIGH
jgi:light-regulated signal transduction histidine kinase (bacteriophytochrome)